MRTTISLFVLLYLTSSSSFAAALDKDDPIYLEMLAMDAEVFERGFNHCDLAVYDDILAEDLEFYHDVGGPSFGRKKFITDTKHNICESEYHPRRELVRDSMSVFPLYENGELYGALVNGEHAFLQTPPGEAEQKTGLAKFSMLWLKNEGRWQLKRVFSYDHTPVGEDD